MLWKAQRCLCLVSALHLGSVQVMLDGSVVGVVPLSFHLDLPNCATLTDEVANYAAEQQLVSCGDYVRIAEGQQVL